MTADQRRHVVVELRRLGQSTRQIADTLGVGQMTVVRDLATESNDSVGLPERVTVANDVAAVKSYTPDLPERMTVVRDVATAQNYAVDLPERIIAGEQRWRAAKEAGLSSVPVRVFDADEETVERLRIEENLRRRTLKPSETARAIRRLHQMAAIRTGPRGDLLPEVTNTNAQTRDEIAQVVDLSPAKVSVYNTLANLIPPLSVLMDKGQIPRMPAKTARSGGAGQQDKASGCPVARYGEFTTSGSRGCRPDPQQGGRAGGDVGDDGAPPCPAWLAVAGQGAPPWQAWPAGPIEAQIAVRALQRA